MCIIVGFVNDIFYAIKRIDKIINNSEDLLMSTWMPLDSSYI